MANVTDLINDFMDTRQIETFDAIDELAKLKAEGHIDLEIPQLIVVGEQKSGKSSTLEALVRFRFPVHEELCTRFPIKLILRPSPDDTMCASLELKSRRTEEQNAEVQQTFNESLREPSSSQEDRLKELLAAAQENKLEELVSTAQEDKLKGFLVAAQEGKLEELLKASQEGKLAKLLAAAQEKKLQGFLAAAQKAFGLRVVAESSEAHNARLPVEQPSNGFTDDVLIIEKSGPKLPRFTLVDLPGVWQATSPRQDPRSRDLVEDMVKSYINSERTVVMIIVNALDDFHNSNILAKFQEFIEQDSSLLDRTIGVITKPDLRPSSGDSMLKVTQSAQEFLNIKYKWHVVRNQSNSERGEDSSLEERDAKEMVYFEGTEFQNVERKGIKSLRETLREVLWTHTKEQLPQLIRDVGFKIENLKAEVDTHSKVRATPHDCRQYLFEIAAEFEYLATQAVLGTYRDKRCMLSHPAGYLCRNCRPFFPRLRDDDPKSQAKKLCANVRALSKQFAIAMRKYGKTQIITDAQSSTEGTGGASAVAPSSADNASSRSAGDFLPQETLKKYYSHETPDYITREAYLKQVEKYIECNRGGEPREEASEALYRNLFHHQSENWEKVARDHFSAVWEATENFVDLALEAVCEDEDIRRKLRDEMIAPNLKKVEMIADRTLRDLLNCRQWESTNFHDGYYFIMGDQDMEEKTQQLTQKIKSFQFDSLELTESVRDSFLELLVHTLSSLMSSQLGSNSLSGFIASLVFNTVKDKLSSVDSHKQDSRDKPSKGSGAPPTTPPKGSRARKEIIPDFNHANGSKNSPERATYHVETYYHVRLLSSSPLLCYAHYAFSLSVC